MFLKKLFNNIKIAAVDTRQEKLELWNAYIDTLDEVSLLETLYTYPNPHLEAILKKEICEIKYCPEDCFGSLQYNSPRVVVHACPNFSNAKCKKDDCPAKAKNHAYIDAFHAYKKAAQEHKNAWKRVFGIRVK